MRTKVVVEAAVLVLAGVIAVVDGLRLIVYKSSYSVEDITGPGRYLLVVGVALCTTGLAYFIRSRAEPSGSARSAEQVAKRRLALMSGAFAVYLLLMNPAGYLLSTLVFFLLILPVFGFRSRVSIAILSVGFTATFYVIFVWLLGMIFPRGVFGI
jgi:putative tricarboxylic transport membrane protein